MQIIGITGGVGAGKSAVLDYIEENFNAKVLKADEIAHKLMLPEGSCYRALREILPQEVFEQNGEINRLKLAKLMFVQEDLRSKINGIVHPAVKVYIIDTIAKERERNSMDYLVIEAALLIEAGYDKICNQLWYIYTSEEHRKQRLMMSRRYSEEKIEQIFSSQLSETEYRRHCHVVIDNNGEKAQTFLQIKERLAYGTKVVL